MDKIDHLFSSEKFIEVGCNCHPETCCCGGSRTIVNPNYREKTFTVVKKKKKSK